MHIHLRLFIALLPLLTSLALPAPKLDHAAQTTVQVIESGLAIQTHIFRPRQDNSTSSLLPPSTLASTTTATPAAAPEPTGNVTTLLTHLEAAFLSVEPTETVPPASTQSAEESALETASTPDPEALIHFSGKHIIQALPQIMCSFRGSCGK
ncbi:hypothetical protein SISSUDRAFT_644006 [Sistotremastrum suecicum HHB10207 ss-3]|uniref:Uncharacterized protein n=1 Tax=Sistotremastrum suecicum HHB10207 ss-3 TaxID=1314776 RepID=A0A165X603_9AGAM|nr:hypothetical protein SISSUDRAFT_644006 [Sistotremastrum suecicum HHB10207 ss-3]